MGPVLSPTIVHETVGGDARRLQRAVLHRSSGNCSANSNFIEPSALVKLLAPIHWTLRSVDFADAQMRGKIALRVISLLTLEGAFTMAVDIARSSMADLEAARSRIIVSTARKSLQGAPSASAASVLQPAGHGLEPYTTPSDRMQQALASLHTDILLLLFRAELALGLRKETKKKRDEHAALRKAQLKRREQQHIYGVRSRADAAREKDEDETGPDVPQTAPACEQRLSSEFAHDAYARRCSCLKWRRTTDRQSGRAYSRRRRNS